MVTMMQTIVLPCHILELVYSPVLVMDDKLSILTDHVRLVMSVI